MESPEAEEPQTEKSAGASSGAMARIEDLKHRLSRLSQGERDPGADRQDSLLLQLKAVEERMYRIRILSENNQSHVQEAVGKLQQELDVAQRRREELEDGCMEEITTSGMDIEAALSAAHEERQNSFSKLRQLIAKRADVLRLQLQRTESESQQSEYTDLPRRAQQLAEAAEADRQRREERYAAAIEGQKQQLEGLKAKLEDEKAARRKMSTAMRETVETSFYQIQSVVQAEYASRDDVQQQLMDLLENSIGRLEEAARRSKAFLPQWQLAVNSGNSRRSNLRGASQTSSPWRQWQQQGGLIDAPRQEQHPEPFHSDLPPILPDRHRAHSRSGGDRRAALSSSYPQAQRIAPLGTLSGQPLRYWQGDGEEIDPTGPSESDHHTPSETTTQPHGLSSGQTCKETAPWTGLSLETMHVLAELDREDELRRLVKLQRDRARQASHLGSGPSRPSGLAGPAALAKGVSELHQEDGHGYRSSSGGWERGGVPGYAQGPTVHIGGLQDAKVLLQMDVPPQRHPKGQSEGAEQPAAPASLDSSSASQSISLASHNTIDPPSQRPGYGDRSSPPHFYSDAGSAQPGAACSSAGTEDSARDSSVASVQELGLELPGSSRVVHTQGLSPAMEALRAYASGNSSGPVPRQQAGFSDLSPPCSWLEEFQRGHPTGPGSRSQANGSSLHADRVEDDYSWSSANHSDSSEERSQSPTGRQTATIRPAGGNRSRTGLEPYVSPNSSMHEG